jgi:hypothetical protein
MKIHLGFYYLIYPMRLYPFASSLSNVVKRMLEYNLNF